MNINMIILLEDIRKEKKNWVNAMLFKSQVLPDKHNVLPKYPFGQLFFTKKNLINNMRYV